MRVKMTRGFTLVELLVVIAIIGVLVALLLPAIQAARESARRNQCTNNLKQIGLALQSRHDAKKVLPAGRTGLPTASNSGVTQFGVSWAFELLPYVEQTSLYQALVKALPCSDPQNALAMRSPVPTFFCPSRREPAADRNFDNNDQPAAEENRGIAAGGDYKGSAGLDINYGIDNPQGEAPGVMGGALYTFSRNSLRQVTDGTSQSIAVGEKYVPTEDEVLQAHPNADPAMMHYYQGDTAYHAGDHRFAVMASTECGMAKGEAPVGVNCGVNKLWEQFGSEHPSISNFVFLDGHVQAIQQSVDVITLQRISTIADDQVIDTNSL